MAPTTNVGIDNAGDKVANDVWDRQSTETLGRYIDDKYRLSAEVVSLMPDMVEAVRLRLLRSGIVAGLPTGTLWLAVKNQWRDATCAALSHADMRAAIINHFETVQGEMQHDQANAVQTQQIQRQLNRQATQNQNLQRQNNALQAQLANAEPIYAVDADANAAGTANTGCWECWSQDHRRQDCPAYKARMASQGGGGGGGKGAGGGGKGKGKGKGKKGGAGGSSSSSSSSSAGGGKGKGKGKGKKGKGGGKKGAKGGVYKPWWKL